MEFSDVVGIRCECANCGEHYTVGHIKPDLYDLIRCRLCSIGLPADRPVPVKINPDQRNLINDALGSLRAIHRLAAMQSREPKPKLKLSFEVRSFEVRSKA